MAQYATVWLPNMAEYSFEGSGPIIEYDFNPKSEQLVFGRWMRGSNNLNRLHVFPSKSSVDHKVKEHERLFTKFTGIYFQKLEEFLRKRALQLTELKQIFMDLKGGGELPAASNKR